MWNASNIYASIYTTPQVLNLIRKYANEFVFVACNK